MAKGRAASRYRYLLGDSRGEAARLRAQARLWDPTSHALFDSLGVRPGWKVLEIGPGVMPRYAKLAPFTRAKAARLRRLWLAAARERTSLMIAPAVLDVVGRRLRRQGRRR